MILHKRLNTEKDFEQLKPGDIIAVEFKDDDMPKEYPHFNIFHIVCIYPHEHEVILKVKGNIYFNYKMFLEGTSLCKDVVLISIDDECKIKEEEE